MIDFETLGYKNVTKDNPIRFSECLGEFLKVFILMIKDIIEKMDA